MPRKYSFRNPESPKRRDGDMFRAYLKLRGRTTPEARELLESWHEMFEVVRRDAHALRLSDVEKELGEDTPALEKEVYFSIGTRMLDCIIDLCEEGFLIAADPGAEKQYASQERRRETVQGFVDEVEPITDAVILTKMCPAAREIAKMAIDLLKGRLPIQAG